MTLGNRIKANRQRLGLSQDALAERLLVLAEVFGCSLDELTGAKAPEPAEAPALQAEAEAPASEPPRRLSRLPKRIRAAGLTLAGWLVWYFFGKLFWAELGDQTVLAWLFGDSPRHHDYLFGWLLDKYWWCAGISVLAALLGQTEFAAVTTVGFFLGMLLGEPLGTPGMPPGVHQGWLIWGGLYLAGWIFGIVAQRRKAQRPWRAPVWWIAAAACIGAVIVLALTSAPVYG